MPRNNYQNALITLRTSNYQNWLFITLEIIEIVKPIITKFKKKTKTGGQNELEKSVNKGFTFSKAQDFKSETIPPT